MNLSDLTDLVYRFYPRGLIEGSHGYYETEEYHRQREAVQRGAAEYPTWKALVRHLGARYPVWDHALLLLAGSYDSGYSADVRIPGYRIGFHVSLLGPYYAIHRIGAPGEEEVALDLAREIEAAYSGYMPIPPEARGGDRARRLSVRRGDDLQPPPLAVVGREFGARRRQEAAAQRILAPRTRRPLLVPTVPSSA